MKVLTSKASTKQALVHTPIAVPVVAAADLIRFEKNLLQMGFFGAHDTRYTTQSTRRIEQLVTRDGQKMRVSAEFQVSQELGLPSTSDRDKYIAFMRIAQEEKTRHGPLSNPIRFTGYRLLKELGVTFCGPNYEDINRWGQRMAATTITSEQVIYLASRKRYANKTVHVFRSFTRVGQSNLDDTGKTESYEVVLEDWLLDNLNQSYVVPEDFNAYRKLTRPTGKGVFGYLHLWFHASHGRQVEKDYGELCLLLNIPAYRHLSKIRSTMGKALDELITVGYLDTWDIQTMTTKDGYKLVLLPGKELLHVLAISQRRQLTEQPEPPHPQPQVVFSTEQKEALQALLERGVSPAKAETLVQVRDPARIIEQIEYAEYLIARDRRKKFDNPAGFIIYVVESEIHIPPSFVTARRIKEEQAQEHESEQTETAELLFSYDAWREKQIDDGLAAQFPELSKKIKEVVAQRVKADKRFTHMSAFQQNDMALQLLRNELSDSLNLPDFDQWLQRQRQQLNLF